MSCVLISNSFRDDFANRPDMPASVVLLDDNQDLRELMRDILESALNVECTCFPSVREFQKHPGEALNAKVAILDINLGQDVPNGIDAFNWLMEQGFRGKVLFFTGHARTYLQYALSERNGAEILEKPVEVDKLISTVSRALNETP
jgi:FixJ family two-component response regulator